jgi:hypothetical protein
MGADGKREMGGMAEWLKAAVLKTADRKVREFESLSLRHPLITFWISIPVTRR